MIVDIGNFKTIKILLTIYFGKQTSDFDIWFSFQKQIQRKKLSQKKDNANFSLQFS